MAHTSKQMIRTCIDRTTVLANTVPYYIGAYTK